MTLNVIKLLSVIIFGPKCNKNLSVNNDNKNNCDNDVNNWIISCFSNGYIGDLPGVFSVWYSLDTFWCSVNL